MRREDIKFKHSSGTSYARGIIIDGYLAEDEKKTLYEKWKSEWPQPLTFQGGVQALTCEKVLEVGEEQILKTYGKKLGKRFMEVAERNHVL